MSKGIQVTLSVKKHRALNDVQFSAIVNALLGSNFEVRHHLNNLQNYTFNDDRFQIYAEKIPVTRFLHDVQTIVSEHAQYEREQTELRRANEHFAGEHVRLSTRITELETANSALTLRLDRNLEANLTWEQRHTNVTAKLAAKDALLNAVGKDVEVLREKIADQARRLENQAKSIAEYQAGKDPVNDWFAKQLQGQIDALTADNQSKSNAIASLNVDNTKKANAIAGHNQRLASFDAEATRLREELAAERAERRSEAAIAAAQTAELRGQVRAANANFNLTDRALSARNKELTAATDIINELKADLNVVHRHYTDAMDELNHERGKPGRRPTRVAITVHADGSVQFDTGDSPMVVQGNLNCTGEVKKA